MTYDFVTGDTGSKLRANVTNAQTGAAFDLTDCTVRLRWVSQDGASIIEKLMSIVAPAANGIAEYQFGATDLYAPKMKFEIEVTDSTDKIVTGTDLIEVTVREQMA